jgi:hypothetical protein
LLLLAEKDARGYTTSGATGLPSRHGGYVDAMLVRVLGLIMTLAGGYCVLFAGRLNDWQWRVNKALFNWEGGRTIRAYSFLTTLAIGLVMIGLGITTMIQGDLGPEAAM